MDVCKSTLDLTELMIKVIKRRLKRQRRLLVCKQLVSGLIQIRFLSISYSKMAIPTHQVSMAIY